MVLECGDRGALLYVYLHTIKVWLFLVNCRLIRSKAVELVLALVENECLMEIEWKALEGQKAFLFEWFWVQLQGGKVMARPAELLSVHRSARGAKVCEGGHPKPEMM